MAATLARPVGVGPACDRGKWDRTQCPCGAGEAIGTWLGALSKVHSSFCEWSMAGARVGAPVRIPCVRARLRSHGALVAPVLSHPPAMADHSPDPTHLAHVEARITRWRRRVWAAAFAREAGQATAFALVAAGAGALIARAVWGASASQAVWLAILVVPALAVAFVRARKSLPSRAETAAAIDLAAGGNGILLAALERADGRWGERAGREARAAGDLTPDLGGGRWLGAAAAACFVLLALSVPLGAERIDASHSERLGGFAERLSEQIAALAESGALNSAESQAMLERLESLQSGFEDFGIEASMEAVDRLFEELAHKADEQAFLAQSVLDRVESGARDMLEQALADADPAAIAEGARKIAAALEKAAQALGESSASTPALAAQAKALAEALGASMSLAQAGQLLDLAEGLREQLEARLGRLAAAGLLDGARLERLASAPGARAAFERLAEAARKHKSESKPCAVCAARERGERCPPGAKCEGGSCSHGVGLAELGAIAAEGAASGGTGRGPGDAPLTFAGESKHRAEEFGLEALGRIGIDDPEAALERWRVEAEAEAVGEAVGADGVRGAAGDGTGRRRMSPRHRAALEAYNQDRAGSQDSH